MALHREIKALSNEPGLITNRLGPAKLYLDDIQTIYDALNNAANEKPARLWQEWRRNSLSDGIETSPVVITAGEAIANEPDDLREQTLTSFAK